MRKLNRKTKLFIVSLLFLGVGAKLSAQNQEIPADMLVPETKIPLPFSLEDPVAVPTPAPADATDGIISLDLSKIIDLDLSERLKEEQAAKLKAEQEKERLYSDAELNLYQNGRLDAKSLFDADLSIIKLVLGQERVDTAKRQWVEVYVKNTSMVKKDVLVRLNITLPSGRSLRLPNVSKTIGPKSVQNIIINFLVPKYSGGLHQVRTSLYNRKGVQVGESSTVLEYFAKGPTMPLSDYFQEQEASAKTANEQNVYIDDIVFPVVNVLSGDYFSAQFLIRNNGTILQKGYTLSIYLVSAQNPYAPIGQAVYEETGINLAAGETKRRALSIQAPSLNLNDSLLLLLDLSREDEKLKGIGKQNLTLSTSGVNLVKIAPTTPQNNAIIELNAPIKFSWKSRSINNFFLEVSVDPEFKDEQSTFRYPQNNTITDLEIVSTPFEDQLLYLLQGSAAALNWRIVGVDEVGFIEGYSPVQKLTLRK